MILMTDSSISYALTRPRTYVYGMRLNKSEGIGKWDGAEIFISKDGINTCMIALFYHDKNYITDKSLPKIKVQEGVNKAFSLGWSEMTIQDIELTSGLKNCESWNLDKKSLSLPNILI